MLWYCVILFDHHEKLAAADHAAVMFKKKITPKKPTEFASEWNKS